MIFGTDERAQSTLIGFILLFGILILAFSSYQAVTVPNQNAEVEFNHFQDIQDDFTEFQSTLINSVGATDDRSVTFRLGTQYPARLIALNPPPVSGQLQTTPERDVTVSDGKGNAVDVCETDATSRSLTYTPNYNEFQSPQAITYENTFVVREFSDGTVYSEQQLFEEENDQINLLLLNEPISLAGQGTRSFEISPSNQRTVEVSNPIITIPSEFDEDEWRNEILADVPDEALVGENAITGTGDGPFKITIEFDGVYNVSCQGTEVEQEGEEGTGSLFDTQWKESSPVTVQPGSNVDLTAKVLERERGTNRRIDDAGVDFAIEEGIQAGTAELTKADSTTNDGEATVTLDTKGGSGGSEFKVYVTVGDDSDVLTVEIEEKEPPEFTQLDVTDIDAGGTGENPANIEIQYGLSSEADVTFSAEENNGDTDEITETETIEGTVTLNIAGSGNNDFPVELVANIDGGQCLETTVVDDEDTKSLQNWDEC